MNPEEPNNPAPSDGSRVDRRWVAALSIFAAMRVLLYSAVFPVFSNVDEVFHYDLVRQYSRFEIPHANVLLSPNTAHDIVYYGTPEYMKTPDMYPDHRIRPPTWAMPPKEGQDLLDQYVPLWTTQQNYEESQPPLYYLATGPWLDVGRRLGLGNGVLPYWVRFWNVLPAAALVWLAFLTARLVFPGDRSLPLGVAVLAAAIPQDAFYSVQNDVLSPVCFGLAFFGLVRIFRVDVVRARPAVWTGVALAAGCLVKTNNLPLLAVGLLAAAFRAWELHRAGNLIRSRQALVLLAVCAILPVLGLFAWNRHAYGGFTGSAGKVAALGWTPKPISDWWPHPIFTLSGFGAFWSELMASFWRGELVWGLERLAWPAMDAFYWISSAALVVLGVISLQPWAFERTRWHRPQEGVWRVEKMLRSNDHAMPSQRHALWIAFWSFVSGVLFLGLTSTMFDFGKCLYPSAQRPFFSSGRLIFGALIPFLLLYVRGLDWALGLVRLKRLTLPAVVLIAIIITISEVFINLPPFWSQFNLFHTLAAGVR